MTVGKLIYSAIASLDGYVNDENGNFDWGAPDAEVHAFVNEQEGPIGTYLYGRRMYEVMRFWQTHDEPEPEHMRDYADIWRAADKIVYSTTLEEPSTPKTTIERGFDPNTVRAMKASSGRDLSVGGPTLAGAALAAGLVDEISLILAPIIVGGGTSVFPDGIAVSLELRDERRFTNGMMHLRYATT